MSAPLEYRCPGCREGLYTIGDNDGWGQPSVFTDEGRPVDECPRCSAELTVSSLLRAEHEAGVHTELAELGGGPGPHAECPLCAGGV